MLVASLELAEGLKQAEKNANFARYRQAFVREPRTLDSPLSLGEDAASPP